MILTLRSWFGEPNISFNISFKVHKFIRQQLIKDIMRPFGLEEKDPEMMLSLVDTTSQTTNELEVKGPEFDIRNKTKNYGLWLPYNKINDSPDLLKTYLLYYFDGLVVLFGKYNVPEYAIRSVQLKVEDEVLGNSNYVYRD